MNRRNFLMASLGLGLLLIPKSKVESREAKVADICKGYSELTDEGKQETLEFIVAKAVTRKNRGDMKEANALASFAVYLKTNFG